MDDPRAWSRLHRQHWVASYFTSPRILSIRSPVFPTESPATVSTTPMVSPSTPPDNVWIPNETGRTGRTSPTASPAQLRPASLLRHQRIHRRRPLLSRRRRHRHQRQRLGRQLRQLPRLSLHLRTPLSAPPDTPALLPFRSASPSTPITTPGSASERHRHQVLSRHAHLFSCCNGPAGLAVDQSGNVWVANYYSNSISQLNSTWRRHQQRLTGGGILIPRASPSTAPATSGSPATAPRHHQTRGAASATPGHSSHPPPAWRPTPISSRPTPSPSTPVATSGSPTSATTTLTEFVGLAAPVKSPLIGPPQTP